MEPAELISAIRAGSREAFDEMCGRYYAPLTAYARLFERELGAGRRAGRIR